MILYDIIFIRVIVHTCTRNFFCVHWCEVHTYCVCHAVESNGLVDEYGFQFLGTRTTSVIGPCDWWMRVASLCGFTKVTMIRHTVHFCLHLKSSAVCDVIVLGQMCGVVRSECGGGSNVLTQALPLIQWIVQSSSRAQWGRGSCSLNSVSEASSTPPVQAVWVCKHWLFF